MSGTTTGILVIVVVVVVALLVWLGLVARPGARDGNIPSGTYPPLPPVSGLAGRLAADQGDLAAG